MADAERKHDAMEDAANDGAGNNEQGHLKAGGRVARKL